MSRYISNEPVSPDSLGGDFIARASVVGCGAPLAITGDGLHGGRITVLLFAVCLGAD